MDFPSFRIAARSSVLVASLSLGTCVAAGDLRDLPLGGGYVFSPYGQVNQAYQSFTDGQVTTSNILDITGATSRLGFYVKPAQGDGLSFQFESGLGLRTSSKTSQTFTPDFIDWDRKQLRQVQLILSGKYGEFRLGQGSMATDGAAESDLAGTAVLAKSTIPELYGAYVFRTVGGPLSAITIGQTYDNFDGVRRFRVRYDSPRFEGFSIAAAYGKEVLTSGVTDRYYDVALRYDAAFGTLKVRGAAGIAYTDAATTTHVSSASVSVLDTRTGLNLAVATGRAGSGTEASYVWVKAGWNAKLLAAGTTKFLVEGYWGQDFVTAGSDSRMWGFGVLQNIDRQNIELFAGYKEFAYSDTTPVAYRDATGVQVGAQIKF